MKIRREEEKMGKKSALTFISIEQKKKVEATLIHGLQCPWQLLLLLTGNQVCP